jgi:hypothetical protein
MDTGVPGAAATKRQAAAGAINQFDPIVTRLPNTCAPTKEGPRQTEVRAWGSGRLERQTALQEVLERA